MLKTTACYSLEKMVNFILLRDVDSITRLVTLEDKLVAIEFTDLHLTLYWLFENQKVRILSTWRGETDANVSGPLEAIARLGLSKAKVAKDLTVSGDMHVIEDFKALFAKLDIDWDAQLAPLIGDALAFKVGKTARAANQWIKQAAQSLHENTKEYLAEESGLLPPRLLFTEFSKDVRELNRDVDRLAARIKHLQSQEAR